MSTKEHLERWAAIVGPYELAIKVAAIHGVDRSTIVRWQEKGWPLAASYLLDVVEAVPLDALPDRLRDQIETMSYTKVSKIRAA